MEASANAQNDPARVWSTLYTIGVIVLLLLATAVGTTAYLSESQQKQEKDDASWMIFQLGFEHQRLLLAAETGASADEINLRAEIYLSRVLLVRDSPVLEDVRKKLASGRLPALLASSQTTERLLADLTAPGGRAALVRHLGEESEPIREVMMEMTNLNRILQWETRSARNQTILNYLMLLEAMILVLVGLSLIVMYITRKLRKTSRDLRVQLVTQDALLRSVDSAIIGLGPGGRVLYSNLRAEALLGEAGRKGGFLPAEAGDDGLIGHVAALIRDPEDVPAPVKIQLRSERGTRHYILRKVRMVPAEVPGGDDRYTSHIVTISDVTAEEEAAIRREEHDARLVEASRLLAFAAISGGLVHEMSQPLAAIRNYIHALKVSLDQKGDAEGQRALTDLLGQEVDRAIEVVRNVRCMGPQAVPVDETAGHCEVHEAIEHSVRLVALGSDPPPPITVISGGGKAYVNGSLPLIGQVVVNLLKNALSASEASSRKGAEVTVSARHGLAEIAVADYGTGVSADTARTMFSPFSKSSRGGMGLGLAICHRIAANLGGSLSWENREGAGAIFRFTVPLAEKGVRP